MLTHFKPASLKVRDTSVLTLRLSGVTVLAHLALEIHSDQLGNKKCHAILIPRALRRESHGERQYHFFRS